MTLYYVLTFKLYEHEKEINNSSYNFFTFLA
jgi:hypothetical protein